MVFYLKNLASLSYYSISTISDPRERILRHAKESEENPYWIAPCYEKTQPKAVFRKVDSDEPPEKMTKTETFG